MRRITHPGREALLQDNSIDFWLKKASGSKLTARYYRSYIRRFFAAVEVKPDEIVAAWKEVKYNYARRDQFVDEWTEKIERFILSSDFDSYTPLSRLTVLTVIVSFFRHHRIPVEPEMAKHNYVKYHNRDITREEIKQILAHANLRDRTFFLMMLESSLRPYTLVQLRYKHIKRDFEANRVPMMIELPSELLKDRVEARWTFIGEDGFKSLKEYLKLRIPLKNDDVIFQRERKGAGQPFLSQAAFSSKFSEIVSKLGMAERIEHGKPKEIHLYCLRKYYMNNLRCDPAYREFWMCHKTTRTHYVSRNVERHRQEYVKAYENFRIFKAPSDEKIKQLEAEVKELRAFAKFMEKPSPYIYIPDDLHGEERLKALTQLVQAIMRDIEEIKKSGKDFWEESAEVLKQKEKARKSER